MDNLLSYTISVAFDLFVVSVLVLYAVGNWYPNFMKKFYPIFCITLVISSYIRGSIFWYEANFFVTALYFTFILLIYFLNNKETVGNRIAYSFLIPFLASHLWELPNHFLWQSWYMFYPIDFILLGYEIGISVFIIYTLKAIKTKSNYKIFVFIALLDISLCYIGGNPTCYANTLLHQVCGNISRIGTILLLLLGIKPKHL